MMMAIWTRHDGDGMDRESWAWRWKWRDYGLMRMGMELWEGMGRRWVMGDGDGDNRNVEGSGEYYLDSFCC